MDYERLILGMKKYGSTDADICMHGIGVLPEKVNWHVIIAPWWEPDTFPELAGAEYLSASDYSATKVWNLDKLGITYIKTGIGAPVLMDSVLSLGVTNCRKIIFIGSVGALDPQIGIGDIVIPEYSVCGDGASRYIASDDLSADTFGEKAYPDLQFFDQTIALTAQICEANSVAWHVGRTFSIDTVFAQFAHLDHILNMGCNVIEMETAAAFRAAALMRIPMTAIFSVSDNTVTNKSLVSGRTEKDMEYRKFVRRELFPKIMLALFDDGG